jgi:hypothetical protein
MPAIVKKRNFASNLPQPDFPGLGNPNQQLVREDGFAFTFGSETEAYFVKYLTDKHRYKN